VICIEDLSLGWKFRNGTGVLEPWCRFPRVLIHHGLATMIATAEVPCYYVGSPVQPYPVSLHYVSLYSVSLFWTRQALDPQNLGDLPQWTSEENNNPSIRRETGSNPIKDQSFARSLFLPSSLPLPVSGTLCSRLAANHPSVNPTTDPSGLAGGSPLATLIEVVFAKGTLLMGLGLSSPVIDEMTLHAPDSGAMGEVERSVA